MRSANRIIEMSTPEGREEVDSYKRNKQELVQRGQQLYAKIKRSSKYFSQNESAKQNGYGFPFKVAIIPAYGEYCVQGGPGGQYALRDVNLFVVEDGKELRIA